MIDANQVWDVPEAIEWVKSLAEFKPLWIEEPTSPDDVLGHAAVRRAVAPIGVATGEHGMNRVLFKQMFQAEAIDFCQLDSARLGSVNEILSEHAVPSRGQIGRLSRHLVWPGELAERLVQAISYANILHPPLVPHAVIHCSSLCASLTATTHASPPGHRALVSLTMQVVVSVSDQWGI
jgi:hypothetical protein